MNASSRQKLFTHTNAWSCLLFNVYLCRSAWMAILKGVPRSVLILSSKTYHTYAPLSLRRYAQDMHVRSERIIFLKRTPDRRTYMDAISACDVMLDSDSFNAQTTAVDFLWAGETQSDICMCVCIYTYTHTYIQACIRTYIHTLYDTYVCTYTHTHTHTHRCRHIIVCVSEYMISST
jgi:hypothetical protein